jgi:hypothetical protein
MTIENLDFSIPWRHSGPISSPIWISFASLNVWIPSRDKAEYKWSVKPDLVSAPLKLRNTSYSHFDEVELELLEAIVRGGLVVFVADLFGNLH